VLERRWYRDIDFSLIFVVLALVGAGLLFIGSATHSTFAPTSEQFYHVRLQAMWVAVGLGAIGVVMLFDYSSWMRYANLLYILNLLLLGSVLFLGREVSGAQSWVQLGPARLQPSEISKILVIITLAAQLARLEGNWRGLRDYAYALLHIAPPMALILLQPDLGTSMVFMGILFGMMIVAGAPFLQVLGMYGAGLGAVVLTVYLHLAFGLPIPLKDYQLNRLLVFTNLEMDPLGAGYHMRQSLIAIGSGRLWGKGLFAGAQNQLDFLPAQHTDFIFSVVGEELGFVGAVLVLFLFFILIWRGLRIAAGARDLFGSLLAVGVVSMILFHILINVGMTIGIMPITGIPLPFLSYGGSSLLANCLGMGILLNIFFRRKKIRF